MFTTMTKFYLLFLLFSFSATADVWNCKSKEGKKLSFDQQSMTLSIPNTTGQQSIVKYSKISEDIHEVRYQAARPFHPSYEYLFFHKSYATGYFPKASRGYISELRCINLNAPEPRAYLCSLEGTQNNSDIWEAKIHLEKLQMRVDSQRDGNIYDNPFVTTVKLTKRSDNEFNRYSFEGILDGTPVTFQLSINRNSREYFCDYDFEGRSGFGCDCGVLR